MFASHCPQRSSRLRPSGTPAQSAHRLPSPPQTAQPSSAAAPPQTPAQSARQSLDLSASQAPHASGRLRPKASPAQSPHELPHGPVELSAFATERQCNGVQSELASAAETHDVALERPAKTQRSSRDTFGFSKLQDIKEDEELMEQAQMNDENEPPAGSDDDAVVPPLRRSGRDRKLPHVRRESSGMVDSSRSRSARNSNSLDDGNDVDADDADAGAVDMPGVRRSSRERKLPHVRRESSGMVDSSQLKWNRSTREVGNSKTNATSANAAPAELNFLAMAKTLKQRGASD